MPGRSPSTKPLSGAYSIRAHLIVFALALVLPIIGFAGFLVWRGAQAEQEQVAEDASRVAALAAIAIDRELTGMLATLQALETSPSLESGDFFAFHRQASNALRLLGAHIILRDTSGRQLVNTRVPWGTALHDEPSADWNLAQLSRPYVSDFTREAVTGDPVVTVSVPVLEGDIVTHVLAMSVPALHWRGVLAENVVRPDWSGGLVDRKNVFIARLRGHEQYVGRPSPEDLRRVTAREGVLTRTNADGEPVLFAYRRSAFADWLVGIGIPTEVVQAPARRSLLFVLASGLGLLGLSVLTATAFGTRIARPLRLLSESAAALGRGELVNPLATGLREVNEVATNLSAASIGLRERSAALRKSEERYRLATEAFQGAVFDFDAVKNHSERTPRHYEMLGESPGVIPTPKEGWHDRIHPEDRRTFEEARRTMYEHGAPQYEAEYRVRHRNGSWIWVWHRALALRDEKGAVLRVVGAILDITARRHAEEHLKLLVNELNHRVKNTLATVQSIAAQTMRGARTLDEARASFEARLIALSSAHNVLTRRNWEGANLRTIVTEALEPYRVRWDDRLSMDGTDVWVSPSNAVAISMGLYELATNAAKYGALTVGTGRVHVSWTVEGEPGSRRARLVWIETGGPLVHVPERKGFGSRLIERSLAADLGGEARLEFRPEGVVCTLTWMLDVDRPGDTPAYPARSLAAVR
jgi:PAS domain S-box-containing protein